MGYLSESVRADLLDQVSLFLDEQFVRVKEALDLGSPENETALCGSDKSITLAREIIDRSLDVLLFPSPSHGVSSLADVVLHRLAVAGSTIRHASEQAQRTHRQFNAEAEKLTECYQLTTEQIGEMMSGRSSKVMMTLDPHGALRQRWTEIQIREMLVSECKMALECLTAFIDKHTLAPPGARV